MADTTKKAHFIIIDDSELDCFIAEKMVEHSGISVSIKKFLSARDAFDYIRNSRESKDDYITILLLDILMPMMNGLEFVEEFEKLPGDIQDKYQIVAFTSSMNKKDLNCMKSFKSVKYLLDKPITSEVLEKILD